MTTNPLINATNNRPTSVLPRTTQPVKGPFSVSVPVPQGTTPAPNTQPAAPTPTQPQSQQSQQDMLITRLLALPQMIRIAQTSFDKADFCYREALALITIRAFSEPLFPGKKPEDGMRCASNDTEREAAIERLATTNERVITAAQHREFALGDLMQLKNEFEAAKLVAQLLISSSKQG